MGRQVDVLEPAPPRDAGGDGGHGGWVWLMTAGNVFEAELLRGLLETAGVPVALDSFDRSPSAWMYPAGNVNRPVQVLVPAGLLEAARLELMESSLVGAGRMESPPAEEPADARLLRERMRPAWLTVALLTSLACGWLVVVEILGFAPCSARIFCIESHPDAPGQCGRAGVPAQGRPACTTNP